MIHEFDIFLSHASEDKDNFVKLLYTELDKQYRVWYDEGEIHWGDKLNEQIQDGLNKSKYGIVILSEKYLSKHSKWIKQEFETISYSNKLRPILHKIKIEYIQEHYQETYEAIKNILAISSEDISSIIKASKETIGEDSLCSKRNIDYTGLRDLLHLGNTQEAAKVAYRVILQAVRGGGFKIESDLWNKDADFNTIQRLWLKYTNGYFSKYDLQFLESCEDKEFKLEANEESLLYTIYKQQSYDIDKITVTGDKASDTKRDYTKLRDFLKAENFSEADTETAICMLATGKNILNFNFPSLDLRTIDQLWLSASNGKFGLSVQKSVWIDVCNQLKHEPTTYKHKTWKKFIGMVGWDKSLFWDKGRADKGHLPSALYVLSLIYDINNNNGDIDFEEETKIVTEFERKFYELRKSPFDCFLRSSPFSRSSPSVRLRNFVLNFVYRTYTPIVLLSLLPSFFRTTFIFIFSLQNQKKLPSSYFRFLSRSR